MFAAASPIVLVTDPSGVDYTCSGLGEVLAEEILGNRVTTDNPQRNGVTLLVVGVTIVSGRCCGLRGVMMSDFIAMYGV